MPEHIERLRRSDPEPLSLTDRKVGDAAMSAEHAPRQIDDLPGVTRLRPQLLDEPRVGSLRNKADVLAVGLVGNRQAVAPPQSAGLLLGKAAQREAQKIELSSGCGEQKIALVARHVPRPMQFGSIRPGCSAHVMPGGQRGGTEIARGAEQIAKLDPLIATDAGYRRFAPTIGFDEILNDFSAEPALVIEHIMRDPQPVGHVHCVADVLTGAARALPPHRDAVVVELQCNPDDLEAALDQEGRSH